MATLQDKVLISLGSAALFTAISLPGTYKLTNAIVPFVTLFNSEANCPTSTGSLIHTLVFFLITLLSMGDPRIDTSEKVMRSLWGALLGFFLSSPAMYSMTGTLFGQRIASNGCPTIAGILMHAILYFGALLGLMFL